VSTVSIPVQCIVGVPRTESGGFAIGIHVRDDVRAWLRVLAGSFGRMYAQWLGDMHFLLTFPDRTAQQGTCGIHGGLEIFGCLREVEKTSMMGLCQHVGPEIYS
jgi:hypothetical protein